MACILQGDRSSDEIEYTEKIDLPSMSLFHEELDTEDYLFRTNLDEMWSLICSNLR